MISLENFNENIRGDPKIDSPHSKEAMLRQGIRGTELVKKTLTEIRKMHMDIHDDRLLLLREEHYEYKRQQKIQLLLEERRKVYQEWEKDGININNSVNNNVARSGVINSNMNGSGVNRSKSGMNMSKGVMNVSRSGANINGSKVSGMELERMREK